MTVAAVMVVKDEMENLPRFLLSAASFVDKLVVVDTGSTDGTPEFLRGNGAAVYDVPWEGHAKARTAAARKARGEADWLLQVDADCTVHPHARLKEWLAEDHDPDVTAWNVEIVDGGLRWRMPFLMRGDREWEYEGVTHSYLVANGKIRSLRGLEIQHHGGYDLEKLANDIELLAPGVEAGDPRSVYYTGWALKAVGRRREAIAMFQRRAEMDGWVEERWHAQYMAALLAEDVDALVEAHRARPWRHEPLTQAAKIVATRENNDILFLEDRA